jgi:hypothetical protein
MSAIRQSNHWLFLDDINVNSLALKPASENARPPGEIMRGTLFVRRLGKFAK